MRSQGFDVPDELLVDAYSVIADIYTVVNAGQDDDGNPTEPQKKYFARGLWADLQPRSGSQRAAQSGTAYESTHVLFVRNRDVPEQSSGYGLDENTGWDEDTSALAFLQAFFDLNESPGGGYRVDVRREQGGPIEETYTVVFVAPWGTHLEIDLKREST